MTTVATGDTITTFATQYIDEEFVESHGRTITSIVFAVAWMTRAYGMSRWS
jgi:hypothetical protein